MKDKRKPLTIFAMDGKVAKAIATTSARPQRALRHAREMKAIFHGVTEVFVALADEQGQPTGDYWMA